MRSSKFGAVLAIGGLLMFGVWLIVNGPSLGVETVNHELAVQAFAPVNSSESGLARSETQGAVSPIVVNLSDIPAGVLDPNNQFDRWKAGEVDMSNESIVGSAQLAAMKEASLNLPEAKGLNQAGNGPALQAPAAVKSFDSIDYTECCGGGGNVPPDPELAVGPNHVIAVVNVAFEIYDLNGNSLVEPTTFSSFMAGDSNCTGVFDPNVVYDESADRYTLAIDADGRYYCMAVSQTGDPTGSWNIYSFSTASGRRDFFDYPHLGVGNDALYMGANIFSGNRFKEARVWAFDKAAMYAGQSASSVTVGLGNQPDTPQPLNLHGWNQGTWPTSGPHYFFSNATFNGADYNVYSWSDPFGANNWSLVGSVDLVAATGVSAGMPVDQPQLGGQTIQGNDFRPQDFEYRNGSAWTVSTIACNPGGGTVNCIRWAQIDPASATVLDAGVISSSGEYRSFGDLAVDACDGMAMGYTKTSSSIYPSIYVSDSTGSEVLLKSGEIAYTSFESSAPRRWGDYTEMTVSPDGATLWYLGEYSKDTGTSDGRWGTYIGAYTLSCSPGDLPPVVTVNSPTDAASFSSGASVSFAGTAIDNENGDLSASLVWTSDLEGGIGSGESFSAVLDDGTHLITASVTDSGGNNSSDSVTITVGGGGGGEVHVGDLDGFSTPANRGRWNANVTVTVHDENHDPVANATVSGSWSNGANGSGTCDTDGAGQCTITKNNLKNNVGSVTFTVTDVAEGSSIYNSGANHDLDGGSNGTFIVISR